MSRGCDYPLCAKYANFNFRGCPPRFCLAHKSADMINVINDRYRYPDYSKATYNFTSDRRRVYCAKREIVDMTRAPSHQESGQITPIPRDTAETSYPHNKCQHAGCQTVATFAQPGERPIHCAVHHAPREIYRPKRRCYDCCALATHGISPRYRVHCEQHAVTGELDIIGTICAKCGMSYVLGVSCVYCRNLPVEQPVVREPRAKCPRYFAAQVVI